MEFLQNIGKSTDRFTEIFYFQQTFTRCTVAKVNLFLETKIILLQYPEIRSTRKTF